MVELVYTTDLKSVACIGFPVRVRMRAPRSCSLTVKHPPYTRLDVSRLESDPGSNPGRTTIFLLRLPNDYEKRPEVY